MKKFITLLAISIIIVATPACSRVYLSDILPTDMLLTEEAEEKKRIQKMRKRIRAYKKECTVIGFAKGTAAHKHCVKELNVAYRTRRSSSARGVSSSGMGFLCKQSIMDGNSTGVAVHCN